jgi:2-oxo-4-hydroxy-4-carboxy-5-ureidoimidazoline decarboxylase
VAEAVVSQRPFASVQALHEAMLAVVRALPEPALVQFFAGHPELAGETARRGLMTEESVAEQGQLGLARVDAQEQAAWDDLNQRYRQRFGFPFILCVRRHTRAGAFEAFARRVQGSRADELQHNLSEIAAITRLRLSDLLQAGA